MSVIPPEGDVTYFFDGVKSQAFIGQSVAAAILESGRRILRITRIGSKPRGIFCGIGICFDCLVVINGVPNQRACIVEIQDGMKVEMQQGAGTFPLSEKT